MCRLYLLELQDYRLLLQLEHSPELAAFQQEMLGKLLAFDGSAELLHTLEAFFEHNANLAQTAEALFVHRNTLISRMERIVMSEVSDWRAEMQKTAQGGKTGDSD